MNTETVKIDVPVCVLADAFLEKVLRGGALSDIPLTDMQARSALLPAIGAPLEGGIYAGITIHLGMPHALVLLPGDAELDWKAAMAWAEQQRGALPSRFDMLVLWQNLPKEFKEAWYWTSETNARDTDCAWFQSFGNSYQGDGHKNGTVRCRAVRRVAL